MRAESDFVDCTDPVEQAEWVKWFRTPMPPRITREELAPVLITAEAERLFSLDKPSLQALSRILRNRDLWPAGFEWDYSDCTTCAMGLAVELWDLGWRNLREIGVNLMEKELNIPHVPAYRIFLGAGTDMGLRFSDVTPEIVAHQIDKYLAEAGGPD